MKRCFILTITLSIFFVLLFFQNAAFSASKAGCVVLTLQEDTGKPGYFEIYVWNGCKQMVRFAYVEITYPCGVGQLCILYTDDTPHLFEPLTGTHILSGVDEIAIPSAPCTVKAYYEYVPGSTEATYP